MENPATTSDNATPRRDESRPYVFLRTMVSALVFGVLGAWFGDHLGKRANKPGSEMARPIMKWSMGGFWALVAAYSSLKAQERTPAADAPAAQTDSSSRQTTQAPTKPSADIDSASIRADGKMEEAPERTRA